MLELIARGDRLVEVDPKDANEWTEGKALLATGSPFPPAKMPSGKDYPYVPLFNLIFSSY